MKNFFKRFVTCIIAVCIISATALAAACTTDEGNGGENHIDPTLSGYSITVLYPDGKPVKGSDGPSSRQNVGIQLVGSDGKDINGAYSVVSEYGVATINYKQNGAFLIDVINCPRGFEYTDKVTTVSGRGDYTIKLSSVNVSYTINVKLPDGTPASGVTVTLKQNGTDVKSAVTGADGKAVFEDVTAGNYDVEFSDLPADVYYLPTQVTSSTATLTVELIALNELKLDTVMSEEKLAEWDKVANYYDEAGYGTQVIRFNTKAECYDFTTDTIPEGKKVYYYFTADKEGEYRFISKGKYYTVEFFGSSLDGVWHTTNSTHESSNTCEMVQIDLKEGEKFYFAYSIPARSALDTTDTHELSGTREFMIAKPVPGVKRHEVTAPDASNPTLNYDVTFETDTALLEFVTTQPDSPSATDGGIFEICSHTSEYDVEIIHYARLDANAEINGRDDDSGEGKNFKYTLEVPPSFAGNTYYLYIKIKSRLDGNEVEYPTTVPIAITRKGDAEENFSPVEEQHATATAKYPEQTGKTFHYLIGDNTTLNESDFEITQNGGKYYANIGGTEYELVVAIKKNLPKLPYSYATVEYMGAVSATPSEDNSDDEVPSTPSDTRQNAYLTLYDDPTKGEDRTNKRLNYTPFIEEYAPLCNGDGVYGLNAELKTFLEKYYDQRWSYFAFGVGFENKSDCCWLLSCGYYA